jgi:histidinol-phosphate aminotransferase
MSPTPVTFTLPTAPAAYTWEATTEEVAARYGVPAASVVRFDLNTSPAPPPLARRVLAGGTFETELSEYPPSDYRRLAEAAAAAYGATTDEILVGAGADEILDLIAKAFLPAGGVAVIPAPTYAMYRVLTDQRAARAVVVPRLGPERGWALDADAIATAARHADVVWLCSPNNPTGLEEDPGLVAGLLERIAADAAEADRRPPIVAVDEAYAEFVGRSLGDLRAAYPGLVSVRTASKAYALAGLRVGFAVADPAIIAAIAPYRPPGSVAVPSITVVREAMADGTAMRANVERVTTERARLTGALAAAGWSVGPSVTNFILCAFGTPERAAAAAEGLLRRGLVPRTFGAGHPLAAYLRLTVRAADEDDRLIDAANAIAAEDLP